MFFFERRLGWRKWKEATIGRVRNVEKDNKASKYMASDVLQSLSSGSQACAWPPPPKSGWQPVLFLWSHKPNLDMRRLRVVLLASRGAPGRMDGQAHKASWCHTGLVPPAYPLLPTHTKQFERERSSFSGEREAARQTLKLLFWTGEDKSNLHDEAYTSDKL